jgi:Pro-kumamolisin, activation domain
LQIVPAAFKTKVDQMRKYRCTGKLSVFAIWILLSFCARAQSSGSSVPANSELQTLTGSINIVPAEKLATGAPTVVRQDLTEAEEQASLDFSVSLKMRNFAELQQRIGNGEIISPEEMTSRFYAATEDYQAVADWLASQGFQVEAAGPASLAVFARGSIAQIERAFGTKFGRVRFAGEEHSSALAPPQLPAAVAARVVGVNGLHRRATGRQRHSSRPVR